MSKIICFDVDGTLVENRSSWVLLNTGLGCPTDCLDEIYQKTESGQMSFADGVKILRICISTAARRQKCISAAYLTKYR